VADGAAEPTALAGSRGSGLLSLAELTLNSSSRDQAASQMQPDSPSSPSAVASASSDTAAPAATDAAAVDSAIASASQPAAAAAVATGSTLAASPAAAGSPHGRGSSVRLSPPCSPIKTHSSGGLDRAPSWQLQHAAAAAAGTAAHPAPPRSDMDLTRLRWEGYTHGVLWTLTVAHGALRSVQLVPTCLASSAVLCNAPV
jgi:hypothetical protein